jgi:phage terminase small subunit
LIEGHERNAARAAGLSRARVIAELMDVAFADPSELTRVMVRACVNCYGDDTRELIEAAGLTVEPNKKCPTCGGHGVRTVWLADTSKVSPAVRKLFLSAKQTKDGIEVKIKDQTPYLMALAKIVGLMTDKTELSGPGGGPVQIQAVKKLEDYSKDELELELMRTLGVDSGVRQLEGTAKAVESE